MHILSPRGRARLLAAALLLFLTTSATAAEPPGADLASVHAWLQAHSATLLARSLEADAAQARAGAAGALPEPMVEVELDGIDFDRPRALPAQVDTTVYRVRQEFPLWGKRALARGIAEQEASAAGFRRDATWLDLVEQADMAWLAWWHAGASEQALQRRIDALAAMREVARARYAAGLAAQQDTLRAEVELTGMQRELIELRAQAAQARARLNARLGRSPQAPLAAPPGEPEIALDPAVGQALDELARRHPMTRTEAAMAEARAGMAEEVRRERWPDLEVGLGLMQMGNRAEGWELMFGVRIPLQQGARRQREQAATLREEAARARAQASVDQLRGAADEALARWQSAGEQEHLIVAQLLPQAQAAMESALASYQVGSVDFDTLLAALEQFLAADLERLDARRERLEAALQLKLMQGELP